MQLFCTGASNIVNPASSFMLLRLAGTCETYATSPYANATLDTVFCEATKHWVSLEHLCQQLHSPSSSAAMRA